MGHYGMNKAGPQAFASCHEVYSAAGLASGCPRRGEEETVEMST